MRNTPAKFGGRKTKYDPSYCSTIVELAKRGYVIQEIACELGVGTSTMYDWSKAHPEFCGAMEKARDAWVAWHMKLGRDNLVEREDGDKINTSLYCYLGKAHGKLYDSREHTSVQLTLSPEQIHGMDDETLHDYLNGKSVSVNNV